MKLFQKKGLLLGVLASFLSLLLIFALPSPKTVLSQDTPNIYISTSDNNIYGSGGLIPLAWDDDPVIKISSYNASNASGNAEVLLYQANEETVLTYLVRDKDNNQLKPNVDTSSLQLIANQKVTLTSTGTRVNLPISQPGIWLLRVTFQGKSFDNFLSRSENGVLVKEAKFEYVFWAQNFKSKKSVNSGSLQLYSVLNERKELANTTFGSDGIAKTALLPDADVAVAKFGQDVAIFPINLRYLNTSYDYRPFKKSIKETKYFVFTDRPLYKPADTVYFKAIIRDEDDAVYSIPKGVAKVKVFKDYYDEPILTKDFPISVDGSVSGEYKISPELTPGYYTLEIKAESDDSQYTYESRVDFQVQYYRKPEYNMSLSSDKNELIAKDKSTAQVSAQYFFGSPVSNQKIKYSIRTANYYQYEFQIEKEQQSLGDYQYGWWGSEKVTSGEALLDKKGQTSFNFVAQIPSDKKVEEGYYSEERQGRNQVFSIEATINDGSGNVSFARKNVLVYAGEFDIFRKEKSYRGKIGDQLNLPITLVPHFNSSVGNINLKAEIHRENWIPYQEPDKKYPSYKKEEADLAPINTITDKDGNAQISILPQKPGSYTFKVSVFDKRGNIVIKKFNFYVSSDQDYYNFDRAGSNITVSADSKNYLPNGTAKLTIFSQIADSDVFLAIERGRLHRFQIVHLKGNSAQVDIPLKNSDIPNIFAQALTFSGQRLEQSSADLKVSAEGKKMIVKLTVDQQKYGPSDTVHVDVTTTDTKGNPLSAETAVWAVDKALFELVDERTGDIFQTFWYDRYDDTADSNSLIGITAFQGGGGGCFASDTKVFMADGEEKRIDAIQKGDYVRTIEGNQLVSAKVLSAEKKEVDGYLIINGHLKITPNHKIFVNKTWTQAGNIQIGDSLTDPSGKQIVVSSIEWQKGKFTVYNLEVEKFHTFFANSIFVHNQKGGGGRTIFKDTAYWNPKVKTDQSGHARVSFQLPDNLTTWVLSAVGATEETQVGQQRTEIVVSKDIFIRPVLPNILRAGDKAVLSAIVHNYTDQRANIEVSLDSESLKVKGSNKQSIQIASNQSEQLFWPVSTITEIDKAKLTFSVSNKKGNKLLDSAAVDLTIRPFGFVEKQVFSGQGNISFPVKLSENTDQSKTKINLDLSPTILGPTLSAMKYLIGYPFGCVEQITSKLVPALYAKINPLLFSENFEGGDIDKYIKQSLKSLADLQQGDGGWGWWQYSSSSYYITAYVVENLSTAKSLGFVVSDDLLKRAKVFLERNSSYNNETNQSEPLPLDYEILRQYGLSHISPSKTLTPFEGFSADLVSLAVITNIKNGFKDPNQNGYNRLLSLSNSIGDESFFEAGLKQDFGSKEASTALAVRAMIAAGAKAEEITPYIKFLLKVRRSNYFANTFATSQTIKAIVDFVKVSQETTPNFAYKVSLDNTNITQGNFLNLEKLVQRVEIPKNNIQPKNSSLNISKDGIGELYSTLEIEEFNTDRNAKALNHGIEIKREYLTHKGKKITVGDTVTVKLTISGLASTDFYAVIKDELPAGLIPINTSFNNEQYDLFDEEPQPSPAPIIYSSYDTQTLENGIVLSLYQIESGTQVYTYMARAVTEGKFLAPPSQIELMYNPSVSGRSSVSSIEVEGVSPLEEAKFELEKFIQNNRLAIILVLMAVSALLVGYLFYKKIKKTP